MDIKWQCRQQKNIRHTGIYTTNRKDSELKEEIFYPWIEYYSWIEYPLTLLIHFSAYVPRAPFNER